MIISIRKGDTTNMVELPEDVRFDRVIGALDNVMRRAFPTKMRHKCLNLSRDTTGEEDDISLGTTLRPPPPNYAFDGIEPETSAGRETPLANPYYSSTGNATGRVRRVPIPIPMQNSENSDWRVMELAPTDTPSTSEVYGGAQVTSTTRPR